MATVVATTPAVPATGGTPGTTTTVNTPFYQSKTFWFNLVSAVVTFSGYVPAQYQKFVVPVITVGNLILRYLTNSTITLS